MEVRLRLSDARCLHNLHTADSSYSVDCCLNFISICNIKVSQCSNDQPNNKILGKKILAGNFILALSRQN